MEAIVGEPIGDDFFEGLKDGSYLCKLLNRLYPDLVAQKYEKPSSMPFKQLETIGMFIDGCKKYGMTEKDLFVTLDLHEQCNRNMVVATLISLGRQAQKNGFDGPILGPKEAEANPREFDEQTLMEGKSHIGLQMGTNKGASQAGMAPYGFQRQVYDTRTQ